MWFANEDDHFGRYINQGHAGQELCQNCKVVH